VRIGTIVILTRKKYTISITSFSFAREFPVSRAWRTRLNPFSEILSVSVLLTLGVIKNDDDDDDDDDNNNNNNNVYAPGNEVPVGLKKNNNNNNNNN